MQTLPATCLAAVLCLSAAHAAAQPSCGLPGAGACCAANSTPGCDDGACCAVVCALDSFCCDVVWDATCAALAEMNCAPGTCPGVCPGEGDCCAANGTPGCDDPACCGTVCSIDPYCCDVAWDASCVALAEANCAPGTCPGACPGEGDCCAANGTPGCDNEACCDTVCSIDPYCCDVAWDASCAALAEANCAAGTCPGACPGEGACCTANGTPGCDEPACCDTVCAIDPTCCDLAWDADCAALAAANCTPGTCPAACPGEGDCCAGNGAAGCDDPACCNTVCAIDPYCCDVSWDASCAALALFNCAPELPCFGDTTGDGVFNAADSVDLYDCFSGPENVPQPPGPIQLDDCLDAFDTNVDFDVDVADLAVLQQLIGP